MGFVAYRRSNTLKALDLRIELKKSVNSAYIDHERAVELVENADKSRKAIASAMGMFHSGRMKLWSDNLAKDKRAIEKSVSELPCPNEDYKSLTAMQLETKIVEIHRLQTKVTLLVEKYTKEIANDDEGRKFLREQARAGA